MAVRMFGAGGGKKIKDATFTPADLRFGKVGYNNDGRQVGTMPDKTAAGIKNISAGTSALNMDIANEGYYLSGADISVPFTNIRNAIGLTASQIAPGNMVLGLMGTYGSDATITAADVARGKIAYGKNGRVVGTADTIKKKSVTLARATIDYGVGAGNHVCVPQYDHETGNLGYTRNAATGFYFKGSTKEAFTCNRLLYAVINGIMFSFIRSDGNVYTLGFNKDTGQNNDRGVIAYQDGYLYYGAGQYSDSIELAGKTATLYYV